MRRRDGKVSADFYPYSFASQIVDINAVLLLHCFGGARRRGCCIVLHRSEVEHTAGGCRGRGGGSSRRLRLGLRRTEGVTWYRRGRRRCGTASAGLLLRRRRPLLMARASLLRFDASGLRHAIQHGFELGCIIMVSGESRISRSLGG